MQPDERIQKLEEKVKELEEEKHRLKERLRLMQVCAKVNPSDKWYVRYLMQSNSMLERECDSRQEVIDQYSKHYQKWGKFYTEYENK